MFVWVQVLRGIAASMVVCFHYVSLQQGRGAEVSSWLSRFGNSGVDIFFVISGFIMMITQVETRGGAARTFLLRRFARIAPLYWVLTIVAFALATLFAQSSKTAQLGVDTLVNSLLFLPSPSDDAANWQGLYVLPMAWTLSYEWFFYVVFAISLALGLASFGRVLFLAGWFFLSVILGLLLEPSSPTLRVLTGDLSLEFLLGCVVALLHAKGVRLRPRTAIVIALAASFVLSNSPPAFPHARPLVWGAAAFALVAAAALTEQSGIDKSWVVRPLARLGDISYSLYLSHWFAVALFRKVQARVDVLGEGFGVPAILAFVALTLAIAEGSYRVIEEPARRLAARVRKQRSMRPSPQPP